MCFTGRCPNENSMGECRGRKYGACPDEDGFEEARDAYEAEYDAEMERRAEDKRERGVLDLCRDLVDAGDNLAQLMAEDRERIANTKTEWVVGA